MKKLITEKLIDSLVPPAKGNHIVYDKEIRGFGVCVTAAGVKSFVLSYSINGRARRYTFRRCNEGSALAARIEANRLRGEIQKGNDPLSEVEIARAEGTLAEFAVSYIDDYAVPQKRKKSVYEDRRMLNGIILPKLGRLRISAVKKIDIQKLHNSLKPTPYQANRVLSLLKKMFACAVDWEMRLDNPARKIKKFPEDRRETWLSREQLKALSDALDDYPDQNAADALRLLIVTGSRPNEVLSATWPMFDLKRGLWIKPSHHTKQVKVEHMPLNPLALAILKRMSEHKTGIHLFPGREGDKRARTTLRNTWKQVCKSAGLVTEYQVIGRRGKPLLRWKTTVRGYDLRHTFASHLVNRNKSLVLVGKLLGHTQSSTTDRYAHASDEALRDVTNDFGKLLTA